MNKELKKLNHELNICYRQINYLEDKEKNYLKIIKEMEDKLEHFNLVNSLNEIIDKLK